MDRSNRIIVTTTIYLSGYVLFFWSNLIERYSILTIKNLYDTFLKLTISNSLFIILITTTTH